MPTTKITKFKLYKNSTGQIPEIIINLIQSHLYERGINQLVEILKTCRSGNELIQFKVRSPNYPKITTAEEDLPSFYMRASDLYIVGYKIEDKIRIFEIDSEEKDQDGFPSLTYTSKSRYNFCEIMIYSERNKQAIKDNWKNIHTLGYLVAEAVREEEIEKYTSTNLYKTNIDILSDIYIFQEETLFVSQVSDLIRPIKKVLSVSTQALAHGWKQQKLLHNIKDVSDTYCAIVGYIEHWNIFNLGTEEERKEFIRKCLPFLKYFLDNIDSLCTAMDYEGPRVKALSNASDTSISAGLYEVSSFSTEYYSKIHDSEELSLELNSFDNKPDDDKGGEIITINNPSPNDKQETTEYKSSLYLIFNYIYEYIIHLPKWLQDQLMSSTRFKNLIEETSKQEEIYNINDHTSKLFNIETINNTIDNPEYNREDKVTITFFIPSERLVDEDIILDSSQITGWILPTDIVEPSITFTGLGPKPLLDFNGLNAYNI